MIFLVAGNAPFNGYTRDLSSMHMMLLHWRDIAAFGASSLSRPILPPEAVAADETAGRLECERRRMNLAACTSQCGYGGEQIGAL
jgi:hypothetical protein